eukprot:6653362-Pyramimonas_sp.AAC.1
MCWNILAASCPLISPARPGVAPGGLLSDSRRYPADRNARASPPASAGDSIQRRDFRGHPR